MLAGNFGFQEITSSVISGCLRLLLVAPDALTHLIVSVSQFRGLLFLVRCSCLQAKCARVESCLILCLMNFDDFRLLQHPKVEVYTSVEKARTANLNGITSCCGCNTMCEDPCLLKTKVVKGRNAAS